MTVTAQATGSRRASVLPASAGRAGLGGTLRSEFTKIRSVRSTYWTLAAMIVITIGISALLSWGRIQDYASQPAVLRAVIGGGLFLAVCGLLSYGIGALLRSTAGAITASVALLFVAFVLSGFLPSSWAVHVDKWIPFNAGGAIWENLSGVNMFSPWVGFGVFCAYAAIAVVAGGILFRTRDA